MAWAIDPLGRSLIDLLRTIQGLEAAGVDLFLEQQAIDTTTPAGKLMFQVTGAFAEFERSIIRQRVNAGLRRAVEQGKRLGRPRVSPAKEKRILSHLRKGMGILKRLRSSASALAQFNASKRECPALSTHAQALKCFRRSYSAWEDSVLPTHNWHREIFTNSASDRLIV
jgi:DNA invertase Pin-like site-specific DNA recombinase